MTRPGLDLRLSDDVLDLLADALADRVLDRVSGGTISLTITQAAAATGLSTKTLRRAIDAGDLPASRVGERWVILRGDIEAWLRARRPSAPDGSLRALHERGRNVKRPAPAANRRTPS